ncbi:MAG: hypothetical protein HDQ87_00805 [Clostridia bacterium]|nr:hypothetical protein [Clostridia bacterium]
MDVMAELAQMRHHNNGVIELREAQERGITLAQLSQLVTAHKLKRLDRNRYILPMERSDDLVTLMRMDRKAILSHDTALYLHGLIPEAPKETSITLPTGHSPDPVVRAECKLYFIGEPLMDLGLTLVPTPQGNLVPSYDLERTICDITRSRARVGTDLFFDALMKYVDDPRKDLDRLNEYADKFMCRSMVNGYLEPLLLVKQA